MKNKKQDRLTGGGGMPSDSFGKQVPFKNKKSQTGGDNKRRIVFSLEITNVFRYNVT